MSDCLHLVEDKIPGRREGGKGEEGEVEGGREGRRERERVREGGREERREGKGLEMNEQGVGRESRTEGE